MAVPPKKGHGDIVDREEPSRLKRDRPRVALNDHRVEWEMVGGKRLSTAFSPVRDFKDAPADAEGGAVV